MASFTTDVFWECAFEAACISDVEQGEYIDLYTDVKCVNKLLWLDNTF